MEKELLINETEAFAEILKQIKQATDSIYICMFIWRDDDIGNLIAEELIKAANRGVKIEILKDKSAAVFEKIEQKKQSFFHKEKDIRLMIKEWLLSFLYYRDNRGSKKQLANQKLTRMLNHPKIIVESEEERGDHSKLFIFDEEVLILGGMNIGDKKLGNKNYADYVIKFVDCELVNYFWKKSVGAGFKNPPSNVEFYFNIKERNRFEIKPKVLSLLEEANYRVDIEMAYFGDPEITEKIIELAQSGLNITIITSKECNVQQALNQRVLNKIIKESQSEVKVYLSNRLIHSKFMCIDRKKIFLGSANFHKLGMNKLSELNVLVEEADDLCNKWELWRQEHLQDCVLLSEEENLNYNKLIALTEGIVC